jgi:hypothetical protein
MSRKDGKADLTEQQLAELRAERSRARKDRKEINRARYLRAYARRASR